ncbi:hypothetical protein BGY98DRAFT_272334 [Russula aff. rugulosa BPL654]|nr:hypothetical protein BGY98DRAFT_272334 [Russula aff. rugulosa BPL654]
MGGCGWISRCRLPVLWILVERRSFSLALLFLLSCLATGMTRTGTTVLTHNRLRGCLSLALHLQYLALSLVHTSCLIPSRTISQSLNQNQSVTYCNLIIISKSAHGWLAIASGGSFFFFYDNDKVSQMAQRQGRELESYGTVYSST